MAADVHRPKVGRHRRTQKLRYDRFRSLENYMPLKRHPHSIRFSRNEWNSISRAAARYEIAPGEFVREAAVRVAAEKNGLSDVQLTRELIELIKKTFRGVHVLAYLKHKDLSHDGEQHRFKRAVSAAQSAQEETLNASDFT